MLTYSDECHHGVLDLLIKYNVDLNAWANREGWIDADDFDREMGIID